MASSAHDPVEWSRQRWIEQEQPLPEQFSAMAAVLRTHQAMCAIIDAALRTHDLTRTGYLLMTTLMMSRDRTRPLGQLGKHLMVHPTTVTLVVDQLEKRELVTRTPHPTDRRTVLASLTPAGTALLDKATKALADVEFGLTGVSEGLSVQLVDVLREARARIDDAG
ncbi:MAG TPA: MarR family transcriptional regulator [Streptosporangiaceae bacterium]